MLGLKLNHVHKHGDGNVYVPWQLNNINQGLLAIVPAEQTYETF